MDILSDTNSEVHREISEEYRIEKDVGSGGTAYVMSGFRKSDDCHVAIKVLSLPSSLERDEAKMAAKRFYR